MSDVPDCPRCATAMQITFRGTSLSYYVCPACGQSKMDVQPRTIASDSAPLPTGLVCLRCDKPFAVIDRETVDTFACRCPRCGYEWTVAKSEQKPAGS